MRETISLSLAGAFVFALASCSPNLSAEDGFYGCVDGGGCPTGTTCRLDGRCHKGTEMGALEGTPCTESNECAVGLHCLDGNAEGQSNLLEVGYCGRRCDGASGGEANCGEDTFCLGEECVIACEGTDACPGDARCRLPEFPRSAPGGGGTDGVQAPGPFCVDFLPVNLFGDRSCTLGQMNECSLPGFCLGTESGGTGLCSMRCEANGQCPAMGQCLQVSPIMGGGMWGQCFLPCIPGDSTCGEGLSCEPAMTDGEPTFCMPTAWSGIVMSSTFLTPPGGA